MNGERQKLLGKWRISSMELWDTAFIDLLGPGYIRFDADGGGEFAFGAVHGEIDGHSGSHSIHVTWEGNDEMDMPAAVVMPNSTRMTPSPVKSASITAMHPPSPLAAGSFSAAC